MMARRILLPAVSCSEDNLSGVEITPETVLWIQEEQIQDPQGPETTFLKAFIAVDGRAEPWVADIGLPFANLRNMEDFYYALLCTLPAGQKAMFPNPDKIESITARPGGTDIQFKSSQEGADGELLFVTETPTEIEKQLAFDPAQLFNKLVAETTTEDVIMFAKHGVLRNDGPV
jgi:hypothetical protein